jgi:hypothetical protein
MDRDASLPENQYQFHSQKNPNAPASGSDCPIIHVRLGACKAKWLSRRES